MKFNIYINFTKTYALNISTENVYIKTLLEGIAVKKKHSYLSKSLDKFIR